VAVNYWFRGFVEGALSDEVMTPFYFRASAQKLLEAERRAAVTAARAGAFERLNLAGETSSTVIDPRQSLPK
jgi:hypothetical protein